MKNGRQNYDWVSIRHEYITTNIGTKKLAEKHGISYTTLANKCRHDGWVKAREKYRKQHSEKLTEKLIEKLAENEAEIKSEGLRNLHDGDIAASLIYKRFMEHFAYETEKNPSGAEYEHYVHSATEIEDRLRSIEHEPRDITKHKMYIESERLKMDQQKAEAFNPDSEIVIRIEGAKESDVESWAK